MRVMECPVCRTVIYTMSANSNMIFQCGLHMNAVTMRDVTDLRGRIRYSELTDLRFTCTAEED